MIRGVAINKRIWIFLALACTLGCESDFAFKIGLAEKPNIVLDLRLSEAHDRVIAEVTVTNRGSTAVEYDDGCGYGVSVGVLDSQGEEIRLYCGQLPFYPCGTVELRPGETLKAGLVFEGMECGGGDLGTMHRLETGLYEVVARFWFGPINGPNQRLEKRREFVWNQRMD